MLNTLIAPMKSTEWVPGTVEVASGAIQEAAWLLIAFPLIGAAILLLLGRRSDKWGHWLGLLASTASFVVGVAVLVSLLGYEGADRVRELHLFDWISISEMNLSAGLRLDPLSLTFVLLVTFVGSLIHLFSVAYMSADKDRRRFFAYLNLFIAAMLLLVLADSFLLMFVGWEGVGLASYLLIGFWNQNPDYAAAAKKAFIVNRVADVGMIIALMLLFDSFGALDFTTVFGNVESASTGKLTAIGLMLLVAACGKSAQFPLQSWLGDAMAGPTPVSALIHAATMVTAGVYLIVRSAPIFNLAPTALLVVAIVGAITLLFGAIVGCAKDDIKKTLAASTMSQIGYMMLAAGLGPIGYAFAIFHLVTHGFFKAGMFLGAGSVMHGMNDQVDMRRFGDLAKYMKITWITFAFGWLAILGIPPFSGFFSKDKIIEAAFTGTGWQPWVFGSVALLGAGITAFYMSRLFFMTFHGSKRWTSQQDGTGPDQKPHESPLLMTIPMIVLAAGSVALGGLFSLGGGFTGWLEPSTGVVEHQDPIIAVPVLIAITLVLVLLGAFLAWRQYAAAQVPVVAPVGSVLTRAARKDLYQDEINEAVFMQTGQYLTRSLVYADRALVDDTFTGMGRASSGLGRWLRGWQNGYVRSYGATMTAGVLVIIGVFLAVQS